jgi:GNAT superfamily N-acetyltransferase
VLSIRPAKIQDVSAIKAMIHELAAFEKLRVHITEADLLRDGFGARPRFRVLIAEWSGQAAGYVLFFENYSSFEGRAAMFLEDIYVREQYRGKGIGHALMAQVAAVAWRENCFGVRWEVLDWNTAAIDFYKKLGASLPEEWKGMLLDGEAFQRLAERAA